ncbi:MAG: GNAT family N-acetyltransferase [Marinifilaceae bacterium]
MEIKIVKASNKDFTFLKKIDEACFKDYQQTSDRSILRSLDSSCNEIFIAKVKRNNRWTKVGSLTVHKYKTTLRITSIAVYSEYRNLNIGSELINYTINLAKKKLFNILSLEALATNNKLIIWYEKFGFKTYDYLHNYYDDYIDAFRMILKLESINYKGEIAVDKRHIDSVVYK